MFLRKWQAEAGDDTTMTVSFDSGRFVSATKYFAEKYDGYTNDPKAIEEIVFKSPDKMPIRSNERGANKDDL